MLRFDGHEENVVESIPVPPPPPKVVRSTLVEMKLSGIRAWKKIQARYYPGRCAHVALYSASGAFAEFQEHLEACGSSNDIAKASAENEKHQAISVLRLATAFGIELLAEECPIDGLKSYKGIRVRVEFIRADAAAARVNTAPGSEFNGDIGCAMALARDRVFSVAHTFFSCKHAYDDDDDDDELYGHSGSYSYPFGHLDPLSEVCDYNLE